MSLLRATNKVSSFKSVFLTLVRSFLSSSSAPEPPLFLRRVRSKRWRGEHGGDGGSSGVSLRPGRRVGVALLARSLHSFSSFPLSWKAGPRLEAIGIQRGIPAGPAGRKKPAPRRRRVQPRRRAPLPGAASSVSPTPVQADASRPRGMSPLAATARPAPDSDRPCRTFLGVIRGLF